VGSKNEERGRTGFAHLFEHVMFQGSAHVAKGEHVKIVEDAGGDMNGSTTNDRTNYYETLPINYLETALWLESDRMGYLVPALTQAKLDNQREVVKNERRESVDNQPYGSRHEVTSAALYPPSNPYSWPLIGSMTDLSAASSNDVTAFFRRYYAPNNAVIAICGDIDVAATKAMIDRYFGNIPQGPPIDRPVVALATLAAEKRLVLEDEKATEPELAITWPTVGLKSTDKQALEALSRVLTYDRTSRLTKVLVYDRQLATTVTAQQQSLEDEGAFEIDVTPRPGVSMTEIEGVVDSVVSGLRTAPPTAHEVARARRSSLVGTVLRLQSVSAKAELLAGGQTYFGAPAHYRSELAAEWAVTPGDVARVAAQYLGEGRVVLSLVPKGKLQLVSRPDRPYTNVTGMTGAGQ
jgi:zinc protease